MEESELITQSKWVQDWFTSLNPYAEKGPLFKIEDANYRLENGKTGKELEALYCLAISSKRYVLFNLDTLGRPIIRKASAHGLGHLRPPYENNDAPKSIPDSHLRLNEIGVERWQCDLWYQIILAALQGLPDQVNIDYHPALNLPAVSRYAATNPNLLRWFKHYNADKLYRDQVEPFNFLVMFQALRMNPAWHSDDFKKSSALKHLPGAVAPFHKDPSIALAQCFDRYTGQSMTEEQLKTYAQALAQYHLRYADFQGVRSFIEWSHEMEDGYGITPHTI